MPYRFREAGRLREIGLGPLHTISLAEARQKAVECRRTRIEGKARSPKNALSEHGRG